MNSHASPSPECRTNGLTPLQALLHQAVTRPTAIAVVSGRQSWSFGRLAAESARLASGLRAFGVRPGDRVALHLTNRIELVFAYYACFRLGAIAAPLNTKLTPAELEDLLRRLEPTLFIGEEDLGPSFEPIAEAVLPHTSRFVVGLPSDSARGWSFEQLMAAHDDAEIPAPPTHKPAIIIPTSGTTDQPKLAVWTPETLASGLKKLAHIGLGEGGPSLIATAMVHGAALTFLLAGVSFGCTSVLLRTFDADEALRLIEEHRITWTFALPAQVAVMIERQATSPRNTGSLRSSLVAGDVSSPELHSRFEEVFGLCLRSVIASTEIGWPFLAGERPVSIGRIPAGLIFRIVDEAGCDMPAGESGELRLRASDCLSQGYWRSPGRIDDLSTDGWFATGDLVRLDQDGDLWFVGRTKDLIVRGGANVSPAEVEGVLRRHPAIGDAAVVGLPDPVLGERVAVAIVLAEGLDPPSLDDIVSFARTRLADYKIPERIAFVPQFPRTSVGKLDRNAVRELFSERTD